MSHVYAVEVNKSDRIYVQADSKHKARAAALATVTIERLDAGDVVALMRAGKKIIDANAAPESADDQPEIPGIAPTAAEELEG